LRNRKGTSIHERIMTVLATWAQQGLGQSPDDEGETERLNTYSRSMWQERPRWWYESHQGSAPQLASAAPADPWSVNLLL
ncbi:MAG: hypothetical protein U9Q37_01305, partial [Euryarchaeota archaeon]|nr:hypothetical protein [Euryarchaeota archaeon]